ncbi:hypothetical protein AB4Y33_12530 [Paraburkholderia sp. BR14319]
MQNTSQHFGYELRSDQDGQCEWHEWALPFKVAEMALLVDFRIASSNVWRDEVIRKPDRRIDLCAKGLDGSGSVAASGHSAAAAEARPAAGLARPAT